MFKACQLEQSIAWALIVHEPSPLSNETLQTWYVNSLICRPSATLFRLQTAMVHPPETGGGGRRCWHGGDSSREAELVLRRSRGCSGGHANGGCCDNDGKISEARWNVGVIEKFRSPWWTSFFEPVTQKLRWAQVRRLGWSCSYNGPAQNATTKTEKQAVPTNTAPWLTCGLTLHVSHGAGAVLWSIIMNPHPTQCGHHEAATEKRCTLRDINQNGQEDKNKVMFQVGH
jgi:hypothetical protein